MTTRMRTITEDEWFEEFRPEHAPNGDLLHPRHWGTPVEDALITQMAQARRLWTAVDDGDGNIVFAQGYHYVNREYYIICDVPYAEDELIDVTPEAR